MAANRCLLILGTILIFNIGLFAQQPAKTKADKQFEKAVQFYERRDFSNTLRLLDGLLGDEPDYAKAWLLKADMY